MLDKYVCPECNGSGIYFPTPHGDGSDAERCGYCYGTGFASDEDVVEHFHHYDD